MQLGSRGAKTRLLNFVKQQVRAEMKTLTLPKTPSVLRSDGTIKGIQNLKFPCFGAGGKDSLSCSVDCPAWSCYDQETRGRHQM